MSPCKIAFAGAGKLASALSNVLFNNGYTITRIVSPGKANGERLASSCNAEWSVTPDFSVDTDIIFVAVPDQKLEVVLKSISCGKDTVVVHTAGSFGLEVFPDSISRRAVFYPLQTFTKGREIRFSEIPVFIESDDKTIQSLLFRVGESLGCTVFSSDLEHRRLMHVAAVFVSNFTNYMLSSGKLIIAKADLPFDLLKPLINETIHKALEIGPENSQTGPAVRHDINTIEKHLELLSFSPELEKIYKELSDSIMSYYKK